MIYFLRVTDDAVRNLKRDFHWQSGYGAFSVSPSHIDALKTYIANQEEHHKQESFQDEFRRLCKKYGVEIDERVCVGLTGCGTLSGFVIMCPVNPGWRGYTADPGL